MLNCRDLISGHSRQRIVYSFKSLPMCLNPANQIDANVKCRNGSQHRGLSSVKPMSAIPVSRSSWVSSSFELLFRYGGLKKSLYKIQEKAIKEHGLICKRALPFADTIWLANPSDLQTVFSTEPKYPQRFKLPIFDYFYEKHTKDPGVFFLNGKRWRKHKMALSKKMLRPPQINKYIPRINYIASELITRMKTVRNPMDSGNFLEIDDIEMELFQWSFETVTNFLFDRRFYCISDNPPAESAAFINAIAVFLKSITKVSLLPPPIYRYIETKPFKTFESSFLTLYEFAEKLIDEKLNELKDRDVGESLEAELIPYLLSKSDVTEEDLESSIVDTLFAGVDTTSNTMLWMLYRLAKNPDVQSRVREEVFKVISKHGEPDEAALNQMPLLKSTIKETLRLYPVLILTGRVLSKDVVLSNYHVPADTSVMFMHHGMGRCEDIFTNANAFAPERWLRSGTNRDFDSFASIPFGFGVRMCLGRRLAELELQVLLAKILQRFKLCIDPEHHVSQHFRGTNVPDRPIKVKFYDL